MPKQDRVGDLEVQQDLVLERREWVFERFGWGAMALIVGLALLGLFGNGPLSSARVASEDGSLQVEYQRFLRRSAPSELRVQLGRGPVGKVRLDFDQAYFDHFRIEEIRPPPRHMVVVGGKITFTFQREQEEILPITFFLQAKQAGRLHGRLEMADAEVTFGHFVYP